MLEWGLGICANREQFVPKHLRSEVVAADSVSSSKAFRQIHEAHLSINGCKIDCQECVLQCPWCRSAGAVQGEQTTEGACALPDAAGGDRSHCWGILWNPWDYGMDPFRPLLSNASIFFF